ncbi:MAG: branched-chain amino acid transport system substrate-binding protein [Acidobacteriota bacterium]|jgi:branched-chain amino acid transport system substrate-binding protein|nr:branched-chain amino acid transport system substrate-binding protein [Acidobacteriota bacterium]
MRRTLIALGLIAALFASMSCTKRGGNCADPGGTIKVGVYGDLTGQTSSFGQSTRNGSQMAADEINAAGGINGRQVQLILEDDQGEPGKAATVVAKLINQDQVRALIGEVASSNSIAAAPNAQEAKVPMISPSSTNPKVTQIGDYIFRVCFIDPFQGEVMAKFASNTLKAKRAAILFDSNSDYSKGLIQFFKQAFTKLGGEIVAEQAYAQRDRDFTGQLTQIRSANPDVIYVPGYYQEVGVIAKQTKQLGIKAPLLGGDGWDSPQLWDLGGESLNGSFISNHYSVDDPSPVIQDFVKRYKAKYNGVAPDALAALAYDAMMVLADSIKRANGTECAALRDAIAQTKDFKGITGVITLDTDRNAVKPAVVLELRDKRFVYKETIQPDSAAPATSPSPAASMSPGNTNAAPSANSSPAANTSGGNTSGGNRSGGNTSGGNTSRSNTNAGATNMNR